MPHCNLILPPVPTSVSTFIPSSVTRFGEMSPLCSIIKLFGKILMIYLLFGKILNLLWLKFYVIWSILNVVNGQILKSNLAIWSHWFLLLFLVHNKQTTTTTLIRSISVGPKPCLGLHTTDWPSGTKTTKRCSVAVTFRYWSRRWARSPKTRSPSASSEHSPTTWRTLVEGDEQPYQPCGKST